jgi:FkbH-like protein
MVELRSPREDERDRLQELIQRTNQMNFSGNRYTRAQLDEILARSELDGYTVQVTDRFGDYGIVGFCLIRRDATVVRMVDLAMSCRVQAKHVEHAFMLSLMARYRRLGFIAFEAEFRRTERNSPAAQVFQDLGFLRAPDEDGREVYRRELQAPVEMLDHIGIRSEQDEAVGQR